MHQFRHGLAHVHTHQIQMEDLRSQDESSHRVHKVFHKVVVPFVRHQVVVAEVQVLDSLSALNDIHDSDDLLGEEGVPTQAQVLDLLVGLQELAQVVE